MAIAQLKHAGRVYSLKGQVNSLAAAGDILTITPAAHSSLIIRAYRLANVSNATSSPLETCWSKKTGGSASGGTTVTPYELNGAGGTPGFTAKTGVTGLTYSSSIDGDWRGRQTVVGYEFQPPTADDWLWLPCVNADEYSLRALNTPTSFHCGIYVEVMEVVG